MVSALIHLLHLRTANQKLERPAQSFVRSGVIAFSRSDLLRRTSGYKERP